MAYDRFVAICKPLHYETLMSSRACVKMAAAAWASAFLSAVVHTANTFSIPLCQGNVVEQFFCELPHLLKLSCSDAYLKEVAVIVFNLCLAFGCFVFIVLSYVQIFTAVLRMPSEQGRHKAFSMCLPHLAVVSLSVSTVMIACLKPPSISSPVLDLVVAVLYAVVPPVVNPLIYSLRNKELKDALRKLVQWKDRVEERNREIERIMTALLKQVIWILHAQFPRENKGSLETKLRQVEFFDDNQDMLGDDWLESNFADKDLGVLEDNMEKHMPATCPCGKGGQWFLGLRQRRPMVRQRALGRVKQYVITS
ncbi:olfactory receptor 14A16-like [Apteryx mantelli]|uniref:Olfactory receptor 14A16-like n=1 Tax=Apteryx mantelli TaxID=2696672 RepID=A0ABM4FMH6_9AVES